MRLLKAAEQRELELVLERAGERWLDAKAAGKDTSKIDAEVQAATEALEQLNERRTT